MVILYRYGSSGFRTLFDVFLVFRIVFSSRTLFFCVCVLCVNLWVDVQTLLSSLRSFTVMAVVPLPRSERGTCQTGSPTDPSPPFRLRSPTLFFGVPRLAKSASRAGVLEPQLGAYTRVIPVHHEHISITHAIIHVQLI